MSNLVDSFLRGIYLPVILWRLSKKSSHGYELIKEVKQLTGKKMKSSTLYPLLHLLEREGFIVCEHVKKGQKDLKSYSLTEKGRDLLTKMREFFHGPIREMILDLLEE